MSLPVVTAAPPSPRPRSRREDLWFRAVLAGIAVAALWMGGTSQPVFGGFLALFALASPAVTRDWAMLLACALGGWSLFGLMPVLTIGEPLPGPYGGAPWVFGAALGLSAWRVDRLRRRG